MISSHVNSGQSRTQILAVVLLFIGMFVMFWTIIINLCWPQGKYH